MGVRKVNTTTNKLLAVIIVLPAFSFLINYIIAIGFIENIPLLLGFNMSFLWAPFVLWYVKLMLKQEVKIDFRKLPHTIPMLLNITFGIYVASQPDSILIHLLRTCIRVFSPGRLRL